jgi:hypothetical protein
MNTNIGTIPADTIYFMVVPKNDSPESKRFLKRLTLARLQIDSINDFSNHNGSSLVDFVNYKLPFSFIPDQT